LSPDKGSLKRGSELERTRKSKKRKKFCYAARKRRRTTGKAGEKGGGNWEIVHYIHPSAGIGSLRRFGVIGVNYQSGPTLKKKQRR